MSDHIAHIAICEDAFRLALHDRHVHDDFKAVMTDPDRVDDAHMGSITRHADKWSADIIAAARDAFARPADDRDHYAPRKLAFTLGSLTHRAADRLTKPITHCWSGKPDAGDPMSQSNESKIIQDVFVFKEVYASGHGDLASVFSPDCIAPNHSEPAAAAERFFRFMLRRALISMHTFKADDDHIDDWFDSFFANLQDFPKRLEQYAELAANWPEDKVKKYLIDKRFYHRDDALIVLARNLQRGSSATPDDLAAAHAATDKTHSRYARALAKSLDYLHAATELWDGKLSVDEAKTRFDVGVPELSIQD